MCGDRKANSRPPIRPETPVVLRKLEEGLVEQAKTEQQIDQRGRHKSELFDLVRSTAVSATAGGHQHTETRRAPACR